MFNKLIQLLDWIYEKRCYICNNSSIEDVCQNCLSKITLNKPVSTKTYKGYKIFCATSYQDGMKKLIRGIKYHNKKSLSPYVARVLIDFWHALPEDIQQKKYQILPMPLYKTRQNRRGYNQSTIIAKDFAKAFDKGKFSVNEKLAIRIKNTKPLYKLNKKEREEALRGAFAWIGKDIDKDANILIIDDIATTGSSCFSLIDTLLNVGVDNILVLTCCSVGE